MDLQKEIARLQKYGMTQYIAEAQNEQSRPSQLMKLNLPMIFILLK